MRRATLDRWHIASSSMLSITTGAMFMALLWNVPQVAIPRYSSAVIVKPVPKLREAIIGTPSRIKIESVKINLSVDIGRYNAADSSWTLSETGAMYAANTVPLNDSNGTTLIYGHATWAVFGNLPDLRKGDLTEVRAKNDKVFIYSYSGRRDVSPDDTSVFDVDGPPRLVLQTCSGPWDSERSLYSFELVEVRHG